MNEKHLQIIASTLSGILNPLLMPFAGFILLFLFSFLSIMPSSYKFMVLTFVYLFTILMPLLGIYIFQKINGLGLKTLSFRNKRHIPYLFTIIAYSFCFAMMHQLGLPSYMNGIILATLIAIIICFIINLKWKVSAHMVGMGGVVGGLIVFGFLFHYNPVWWLCLAIFLSGALGTSRIILKQHTLGQVGVGFIIGFICAVYGISYFKL